MKHFKVGDLVKLSQVFATRYHVEYLTDYSDPIYIITKKHQEISGIICGNSCKKFKLFSYDIQCLKDNFIMTRMKKDELIKL